MVYKIIEVNKYGTLVKNTTNDPDDCSLCKHQQKCVEWCQENSYYLKDSEAEKIKIEAIIPPNEAYKVADFNKDSEKELIDLRLKLKESNEKCSSLESFSRGLELKVGELENEKTTMIYDVEDIEHTMCCAFHIERIYNYCPNCGRKIIRN